MGKKSAKESILEKYLVGAAVPKEIYPTGLSSLDIATVIGGVPSGRLVEIYGPEGVGKTLLGLTILGYVMSQGGRVAVVDTEHSIAPGLVKMAGLDESVEIFQPVTAEEVFEIVSVLIGDRNVILVDSIAALITQAELEDDIGTARIGQLARVMSIELKRLLPQLAKSDTSLICTNQIRANVSPYGSNETIPGGNAVKFYTSLRIRVARDSAIKEGSKVIGHEVRAEVKKNKLGTIGRVCYLPLYYDQGFSREECLLRDGISLGIIQAGGGWYTMDGKKMRKNEVLEMIGEKCDELYERILKTVREVEKTIS